MGCKGVELGPRRDGTWGEKGGPWSKSGGIWHERSVTLG